jgi:putative oxidoreductase
MNVLKKIYRNQNADLAALILRVVLGVLFLSAAWMKVSNMDMTVGFFAQAGYTSFEAHLVGWTEMIGGILVLIGILNKPATIALSVIMAVVVWGGYPDQQYNIFWGNNYEFMILTMLVSLYFIGEGKWSLARLVESRRTRQ